MIKERYVCIKDLRVPISTFTKKSFGTPLKIDTEYFTIKKNQILKSSRSSYGDLLLKINDNFPHYVPLSDRVISDHFMEFLEFRKMKLKKLKETYGHN